MRKKWDERTKLQLGKLIRNQLDMHIKLNDAVTRAAEILQAPRSTCMNYWQKELKHLDYSSDSLSLTQSQAKQVSRSDSFRTQQEQQDVERISKEQSRLVMSVLNRLRENEKKIQLLHRQTESLLKEYADLTRQLGDILDVPKPVARGHVDHFPKMMQPLTIQDLSSGDIVRVHHHIWQDHYYISSIEKQVVYGYKLSKNFHIRRKSKQKPLAMDVLKYGKVIRRQVKLEEVLPKDEE